MLLSSDCWLTVCWANWFHGANILPFHTHKSSSQVYWKQIKTSYGITFSFKQLPSENCSDTKRNRWDDPCCGVLYRKWATLCHRERIQQIWNLQNGYAVLSLPRPSLCQESGMEMYKFPESWKKPFFFFFKSWHLVIAAASAILKQHQAS